MIRGLITKCDKYFTTNARIWPFQSCFAYILQLQGKGALTDLDVF